MLRREFLLAGLAGGLLAGCGFRLRGTGRLAEASFSSVYLVGINKVPADLVSRLEQQWSSLGVAVSSGAAGSLAQADVLVELLGHKVSASRTSVNSAGDTTGELLKHSLEFVATRVVDETEIVARELITLRDRNLNPDNPLTGVREKRTLDREMAGDLVFQLIDQINRAYANLPAVQSDIPAQDSEELP